MPGGTVGASWHPPQIDVDHQTRARANKFKRPNQQKFKGNVDWLTSGCACCLLINMPGALMNQRVLIAIAAIACAGCSLLGTEPERDCKRLVNLFYRLQADDDFLRRGFVDPRFDEIVALAQQLREPRSTWCQALLEKRREIELARQHHADLMREVDDQVKELRRSPVKPLQQPSSGGRVALPQEDPSARAPTPALGLEEAPGEGQPGLKSGHSGERDPGHVEIKFYMANWSAPSKAALTYLQNRRLAVKVIDIDQDNAAVRRLRTISPRGSLPVFEIDGHVLVGFDRLELERQLKLAAARRARQGAPRADGDEGLR